MTKTELMSKHPILQKIEQGELPYPYQLFGLECGDGWNNMLDELCTKIETIIKKDKLTDFLVVQVKEKFGSLRFYVSGGNAEINHLISEFENLSEMVCEKCGKPGKNQKVSEGGMLGGWYQTLCPRCFGKRRMKDKGFSTS